MSWSDCSVTCGGGSQTRSRTKTFGGDDCTDDTEETQQCSPDDCPAPTGGGGGGIAVPGGRRKRGSMGIMEELTELIRRKREVRYRCNMTMTYGVMFYDIRNKEVKMYIPM